MQQVGGQEPASIFAAPDAFVQCAPHDQVAASILEIQDRPGGHAIARSATTEFLDRDFKAADDREVRVRRSDARRWIFELKEGSSTTMAVQAEVVGDSWHVRGYVACSSAIDRLASGPDEGSARP